MHKHLPNYTKSSIPNARRLRRDMTDAERRIWSRLRNNQFGVKFRREVPFGTYILDFYSPKTMICIELDGSQHYTGEGKQKDAVRDKYLNMQGIVVLRFSSIEALQNTDGVLQSIYEAIHNKNLSKTPSPPSP
jgi:very-short-patch-repair endonuclease